MGDKNIIQLEKVRKLFAKNIGLPTEGVIVSKVGGGFTGASKFLAEYNGKKSFLKVADQTSQPLDAYLIVSEANIYSLLTKYQLSGTTFPIYECLIEEENLIILILENINATWGGPWNIKNIMLLDEALTKMHRTKLNDEDEIRLAELAREIRLKIGEKPRDDSEEARQKKRDLFWQTWDQVRGGFVNSSNTVYYVASQETPKRVLELAEIKNESTDSLIMQDMNYANIGFTKDAVHFVDPVYMKFGDADFDRTVAGVNILQQLGGKATDEIANLVIDLFFKSKPMLAKLIAYYVFSTHKKVDKSQDEWQRFHQECAVSALKIFETI